MSGPKLSSYSSALQGESKQRTTESGHDTQAFKGLEGYRFVESGMLGSVSVFRVSESCTLVKARVSHSQAINETSLAPWVSCAGAGQVINAHCNCMAGLGEACAHIGAVLYAVMKTSQIQKNRSCTSQPCAWLNPLKKQVAMARLSSIPGYKRARPPRDLLPRLFDIQPPPPDAQENHRLLVQKVSKAVGLSILPGFCDSYVPKVLELTLPKAFNTFFSKNLLTSSYEELLVLADEAFESLSCTDEEAGTVEKETREQSENKLWYEIRAGRITGSKFHAAVHTDPEKPSVSLLKSICYPMASKFQTESTRWGMKNEPVAMKAYQKMMSDVHGDFVVEQRGFMLLKSFPFIGASPDGAVFCRCHRPGLVEIKCPFSHRQRYVKEAALADKNFCCAVGADGSLRLKDSHPYFFEIQLTMFIMEITYCHFVIWTQVDYVVLETEYDESLVLTHLPRSELLFRKAVLPELLGKYFTREQGRGVKRGMSDENSEILPCCCRTEKDLNVPTVVYSASTCLVRRFHIPCLGLKRIAKEWKCVECRKQSAKKRRSNPDKTSLSK